MEYQKLAYFKRRYLFPNHHFGYPCATQICPLQSAGTFSNTTTSSIRLRQLKVEIRYSLKAQAAPAKKLSYPRRNGAPTTDSSEEYHYSLPQTPSTLKLHHCFGWMTQPIPDTIPNERNSRRKNGRKQERTKKIELKVRRWAKKREKSAQIPAPNLPPLPPGTNPSSLEPLSNFPPKNHRFSTAPGPLGWKRISPVKVARMHKMESTKTLKETSGWLLGLWRGPRAPKPFEVPGHLGKKGPKIGIWWVAGRFQIPRKHQLWRFFVEKASFLLGCGRNLKRGTKLHCGRLFKRILDNSVGAWEKPGLSQVTTCSSAKKQHGHQGHAQFQG